MPLRLLMAGFYAALIVVPPGGATSGRTDPTYGMAPATPIANGDREGTPPVATRPPAWAHGPPPVPRRACTSLCRDGWKLPPEGALLPSLPAPGRLICAKERRSSWSSCPSTSRPYKTSRWRSGCRESLLSLAKLLPLRLGVQRLTQELDQGKLRPSQKENLLRQGFRTGCITDGRRGGAGGVPIEIGLIQIDLKMNPREK